MKLEQVAFGCRTKDGFERRAAEAAVVDEVTFSGIMRQGSSVTMIQKAVGFLAFDYTLGIEREYLYYPGQGTFHDLITKNAGEYYLSHFAAHIDSIDLYLASASQDFRDKIVMDVLTDEHKNEKLRELGRKYRYLIVDTRKDNGYFTKLIQRVGGSVAPSSS